MPNNNIELCLNMTMDVKKQQKAISSDNTGLCNFTIITVHSFEFNAFLSTSLISTTLNIHRHHFEIIISIVLKG